MLKIKYFIFILVANYAFSCGGIPSERDMFIEMVDAFNFLSKHHHELHIMIGEDEGDFKQAYNEFYKYISPVSNLRLIPIKNGFFRIKDLRRASKDVKDFDMLVDYYQSGLSLEIEGVLKGYGYSENFNIDDAVSIYDKVRKK
tara:strand:- start:520 stop:948 length:429 start_codon:yes stop_codon:yes gene_type:complete